jgi:hypothetical protein
MLLPAPLPGRSQTRPDILFVLADNLGYAELGAKQREDQSADPDGHARPIPAAAAKP